MKGHIRSLYQCVHSMERAVAQRFRNKRVRPGLFAFEKLSGAF